jgi:hypothetical protein
MSEIPTPWAVICPEHGKVYLTKENYNRQMRASDSTWRCPAGCHAEWDDDNYEDWYYAGQFK